ncbi:hypothetical protein GCM10009558_106650 [Virgisporangium aurantiacum]
MGATANSYQSHRADLTGGLGTLAVLLTGGADRIDAVAAILRWGQVELDAQRAALDAVPHEATSSGGVEFHPADEAQADLVRAVIANTGEIRSTVDADLVAAESALRDARDGLATVLERWEPNTLTLLNLNVGQGKGNVWQGAHLLGMDHADEGTETAEMDEIADIVHGNGADVVTVQEVFRNDLGELEHHLESDGSQWEVRYQEADQKQHFGDGFLDFGDPDDWRYESFGNAVLVRDGDLTGTVDRDESGFVLDENGREAQVARDAAAAGHPYPSALPDTSTVDEGRAVAVAEVDLTTPRR